MDEQTSRKLRNLLEQLSPEHSRLVQNPNISSIDLTNSLPAVSASPTVNRRIIPKSTVAPTFNTSSTPCVIMPGSITSSTNRLVIPGSSPSSNNPLAMLQNTVQSSGNSPSFGAAQMSLLEHSGILGLSAVQDKDRNMYLSETESPTETFNSMYGNVNQMSLQTFTHRRTRTNIPYTIKCQISKMAEESPRITQGEIAQIFGIDRTTVSKILKKRKLYSDSSSPHSPSKMSRFSDAASNQHELESALVIWCAGLKERNKTLTLSSIADAIEQLANSYGMGSYTFDFHWVRSFCRRHHIIYSMDVSSSLPSGGPKNASIQYKPAQFQQRNKPSIERRMPPSAASGSASLQENLSRPKPTSRPIPNQSFNKIPRDGSQFTTSVALSDPAGTGSTGFEQREENKVVVKEEPQFEDLGPEEALSRDLGTLEKFREQQKQIEEANKQKKALLAKTLSERQKKARKEAEKLTHIQKELMILDNLLSADVTVIRNRIESASRDYLEATRRYERAEKEFIESKLDLQKKSEIKEELTEHLYTIIHQNEIRKARKLSDLMSELDMETKGEQICIGKLPPLSAFSSVNTVKKLTSPTSPTSPSSLVSQTEKSSTESPSKLLVSPSTDNGGNTSATVDKCSENGQGTDIDLPSTVLDFSNENPATNTSFVEIKNASSSDTISGTLLPSDSVEKIPNYVQEILDISAGSDATVIESVEKQSLSSGTDDASSYNNALSSNPEGDDSSRSPKHRTNSPEAEIQPISMPSTWTLDSVDIKKEPDT